MFTLSKTVGERRREYAAFLEMFLWNVWATFTFANAVTRDYGSQKIEALLRFVEKTHGIKIGAMISPEYANLSGCGKPYGKLHFHVPLRCPSSEAARSLRHYWLTPGFGGGPSSGAGAHIEAYDHSRGAIFYSTKGMNDPAWDFEFRNHDVFGEEPSALLGHRGPRQFKRHVLQLPAGDIDFYAVPTWQEHLNLRRNVEAAHAYAPPTSQYDSRHRKPTPSALRAAPAGFKDRPVYVAPVKKTREVR